MKQNKVQKIWWWRHDSKLWRHCNFFAIYSQFGAIRKPYSRRIVCERYIFIKRKLLSYKNWKNHTIALSKGTIFAKKRSFFAKKCWHQQNTPITKTIAKLSSLHCIACLVLPEIFRMNMCLFLYFKYLE